MNLESAKCLLGTKRIDPTKAKKDIERGKPRGAPGAATLLQDTVLTINDPGIVSGNATKYTVQIKANDSDLRFLDPKGVVVGLYAKGKAKKDTSGFVKYPTIMLKAA